jgi:adenylosuccinate lyase
LFTGAFHELTHLQELGLTISDKAIEQMKANLELDEEQMKQAAIEEKKRRRRYSSYECRVLLMYTTDDVMAHVHVFGLVAPEAAPIIQ